MDIKRLIKSVAVMAALITGVNQTAYAGSQQEKLDKFKPEQIMKFAKQVEYYAADKGAKAFIIARVGQPEKDLPKGIHYTHTAIAVYSQIKMDDGSLAYGYAIHNLYQNSNDLDHSSIVVDYPTDFFWSAHELKAGVIIPTVELQNRLIEQIADGTATTLHNPNYSIVANPFNSQYQNCTEHTLDMINAAIYQTNNVEQLKANAKAHFTPHKVRVSKTKLFLGSIFADGIARDDHKGKVYTTTFTSIYNYLAKNNLVDEYHVIKADDIEEG